MIYTPAYPSNQMTHLDVDARLALLAVLCFEPQSTQYSTSNHPTKMHYWLDWVYLCLPV